MNKAIDSTAYPWLEKLDEETSAEILRQQEFDRQWRKACDVLEKYRGEKGWTHPSIESEFSVLMIVHRMGEKQFYSRQQDLAAIKRYKTALKQIETPDFSYKLSRALESHFTIEAEEYIRKHPNYLESTDDDRLDARNSHPAIQFLKHGKHIRRFLEPRLDELADDIESEERRGRTNFDAIGYYKAARKFWEQVTCISLPQLPNETHEFMTFFQEIIDAFEIKASARSVAQAWDKLEKK